MSHGTSAALSAEILEVQVAARALNVTGVFCLSTMAAILTCVMLPSMVGRTGVGLLLAAVLILGGDLLSRGRDLRAWSGTSLMVSGYALAYFFAHATHYVSGFEGAASPVLCWLLKLGLAVALTFHAGRHRLLRWFAIPGSLAISGNVLLSALSSPGQVELFGFTIGVPAAASVLGMAWWTGFSFACLRHWKRYQPTGDELEDRLAPWLFKGAHELGFILATVNALALPYYCNSLDYAPIWWSIELPVLLAICWRSRSFVKHGIIMAIWVAAAAFAVLKPGSLPALLTMLVPLSGVLMGLAYRLLETERTRLQKVLGFAVYFYGAAAVSAVVPFIHLGAWESLPFWLGETGALLALGLVTRDRLMVFLGCVAGAASLTWYGVHWTQWYPALTLTVIVGCYAFAIVWARIQAKGGVRQGDFTPWPGEFVVSKLEAEWLERICAVLGYGALMTGALVLVPNPYNTVIWAVAALAHTGIGLWSDKFVYRYCGLAGLFAASGKFSFWDLATAQTLWKTFAAVSSIGACLLAAGNLYMASWRYLQRNSKNPPPDQGGGTTPPSDTDNGGTTTPHGDGKDDNASGTKDN